jgi:propionyl-CoA carboxylase alpha chain
MFSSDANLLIMSLAEYQLARHMKEPIPVDLGNFVLSPMPGTLISYAVQTGDVVEMDQELCVVEAMKMQNVIRSHKAGATVGALHGKVGASLRADEVLLEFDESASSTPPS